MEPGRRKTGGAFKPPAADPKDSENGTMDYLKHFNLNDRPFKNTYDPKYFFRTGALEAVFQALRDGDGPPLIRLSGPSKTGRTFVLRRLSKELRDGFKVVLVLNPRMTLAEIFRQALSSLGQSHKFNARTPEEELLGYFQNAVSEILDDGQNLLLAVDDSRQLSPEILAELLGLTELEPHWRGRVRLLLVSDSEEERETLPGGERPALELEIPPLTLEETEEFVLFRLKGAGGRPCFSKAALKVLWEYSQGRPERVNHLAERALISAWSSERDEVNTVHLKAARTSLETPPAVNRQSLKRAAAGPEPGGEKRPGSSRSKAVLLIFLVLVAVGLGVGLHLADRPSALAVLEPDDFAAEEPGAPDDEPALTATPAPEGPGAEAGGVLAPSLPTPPPQLLSLPQGSLALVVDQDAALGRLWQGGAKGPGLKAEVASPAFKNNGLYLFGRPRGDNPLIFQFPPARDLPRDEARALWPRVATLLPQNILPVIVAPHAEYLKERHEEAEAVINNQVKAWVQAQQYRFPDTMASLYASTFQFFELGRPGKSMSRESFRKALASELRTAGEVSVNVSQPLIMQDPAKNNLFWAVFNIKYESRLRRDMGVRVLIFEKSVIGREWLITAELWLPEQGLKDE